MGVFHHNASKTDGERFSLADQSRGGVGSRRWRALQVTVHAWGRALNSHVLIDEYRVPVGVDSDETGRPGRILIRLAG